MKTNFSRAVEYIPTFNGNQDLPAGEQIKAKLKVLTIGDFLLLGDSLSKVRGSDGAKIITEANMDIGQMRPLLEMAPRLFETYVEIGPILDGEGTPLKPVEIAGSPFFLALVLEILGQLATISSPTGSDVKN